MGANDKLEAALHGPPPRTFEDRLRDLQDLGYPEMPRQLVTTREVKQAWCDPHGHVGPLQLTEEAAAEDLTRHNERDHRAEKENER